jgi:O-antigen ligase
MNPAFLGMLTLCAALLGYTLLRGAGAASDEWPLAGAGLSLLVLLAAAHKTDGLFRRWWPLLALPAYIALQLLPGPIHSVAPWLTLMQLLRICTYLAVFVVLFEIAAAHPGREWGLLAIPLVYGCAEAVLGLGRHLIRGDDNYAIGTLGDHSHFAGLMELLLPLALAWAVYRGRLLDWAPAALIMGALLHSFSRMGLLASVAAVTAMVMFRTRKLFQTAAATAALTGVILLFAPTGLGERFARIYTYEGFRNDAHLVRWHDTLRLIAERPVFGSGAGSFPIAFAPYDTSGKSVSATHADNDYLQLMGEFGAVGTLAMLSLLALALRRCLRTGVSNFAALGCAGAMIALLVHSIFEFQMYVPANMLTLAWISGVGCGIPCRDRVLQPHQVPVCKTSPAFT